MSFDLETERLTMCLPNQADVHDYRALVGERGDGVPTPDDVSGRIAKQLDAAWRHGIALLFIRRRAEGDMIGYCGLIVGRASADEPEIAYELFRRVHNRGYATEAGRAVLDAATATGRTRLWSTVRSWNAPSLRVLDKLGFERDHTTTDDQGELVWLTRTLP